MATSPSLDLSGWADRIYVTAARDKADALAQQHAYAAVIRALRKTDEWSIAAEPPPRGRRGWRIWAVRNTTANTVDPQLRYIAESLHGDQVRGAPW